MITSVATVALTCLSFRHLRKYFCDEIVCDLTTSATVQAELEKEWEQLVQDRNSAREIFHTGNSKVSEEHTHAHTHTTQFSACTNVIVVA